MTATALYTSPSHRSRLRAATALLLSAGLFLSACDAVDSTGSGSADAGESTASVTSPVAPTDSAGADTLPGSSSTSPTEQLSPAAPGSPAEGTGESSSDGAESSVPTPNSPIPGAGAGVGLLGAPDTGAVQSPATGEVDLQVTRVEAAAHEGFDRVVFEFTGTGQPGWFVDSTPEPRQQGSGHLIDHPGSHAINVMLTGTPYPFELGIPEENWPQAGSVAGTAGQVQGVSFHGIFEATSQYVISLNQEAAFSVTRLEEPTRVVIDIKH